MRDTMSANICKVNPVDSLPSHDSAKKRFDLRNSSVFWLKMVLWKMLRFASGCNPCNVSVVETNRIDSAAFSFVSIHSFARAWPVFTSKDSEPSSQRHCWLRIYSHIKGLALHHSRTTFGSWDVEKVHTVLARSIFPSQNVQNTPFSDHFWKLTWQKSARRCGTKHISKSKCTKHTILGPLLEVDMAKKCTPLWREAHFQVKLLKTPGVRATFGRSDVVSRGRRKSAPCQKWAKREEFVAFPKTMAGVGHLKRICKDAFSVAGGIQKTCSWEMLGGQGADFLRKVTFWSIRPVRRFAKMILRDWCSTSYDLASLFRGKCNSFRQMDWKNRKRHWHEAVSSAVNFPSFRKSRRIASFLMLSSLKNEKVSQNCFVFDVVKFKHWGSLAE